MAKTDRHLVVDGSNIATEGRSLPSLAQLDEAVRAIATEFPYSSLTVIVDATFAHRIDDTEREEFEAAVAAGEIVTPPAGAVGRGDAFILQVAEKAGATVLSNDSYQEFHGEHEWLFEQGRLIGGKPIEGVGWVFVERVPVRGPASRRAVRVSKKPLVKKANKRGASAEASGPPPQPTLATPPPPRKRGAGRRGRSKVDDVQVDDVQVDGVTVDEVRPLGDQAIVITPTPVAGVAGVATERVANQPQPERAGKRSPEELNDPRSFMSFVSKYSIGDEVEAVVDQFSSHGCYLRAASARCYLPSRAMGDPPPNRARDVVSQGQTVIVRVESLDADRRGINVALVRAVPGDGEYLEQARDREAAPARLAKPASPPQEAPVAADGSAREGNLTRSTTNVATTKPAKKTPAKKAAATGAKKAATATSSARVKKAVTRKATATKAAAPAAKKAPAKKAPAKKAATTEATAEKAPAKRAAATKAPAKKAPAKKAATKAPAKKAPAKKATAKKAATKAPAKKAPAKKATAATAKAPAKATTAKAPAKKAPAKKAATARKATTRKAATKRAPARKAPAKRSTAPSPDTSEA